MALQSFLKNKISNFNSSSSKTVLKANKMQRAAKFKGHFSFTSMALRIKAQLRHITLQDRY